MAKGRAFVPVSGYISVLHGKKLNPKVALKVMVDVVIDESATLPYPTEEVSLLSKAVGSIIAWPLSLIVIEQVKCKHFF